MAELRILITNNTLSGRAGSELYVRDLAIGLLKRGHTPVAYSTRLGEVAEELRAATVPVIDNLDALGLAPDIIHGQHHLDAMTALLSFPGVPAVFFCHGWLPWEEMPPRFPRILRYVAVDHTCRDRLLLEHAIAEERIRVIFNFVDLERFKPRGPLPDRPGRALIFSNWANENTHVPAVRRACAEQGIRVDVLGAAAGKACATPEHVLGDYDIVFAKARCALEALAVGTSVIVCDARGLGPMVTTGEFKRLRSLNFGIRTLRDPIKDDVVSRELARYNPGDASEVSQRIRAEAGLDRALDEIISLYEDVIREYRREGSLDMADEVRAAAAYLYSLAPRLKERDLEARLLETRLVEKGQALQSLTIRLALEKEEREKITRTLGWRLLNRYGPIKYRVLLPVYNRVRRLIGRDVKRQEQN